MQFQQVIPEGVHDIHLAVSIPIIHHYALNFSTDAFILNYTDCDFCRTWYQNIWSTSHLERASTVLTLMVKKYVNLSFTPLHLYDQQAVVRTLLS